MEQSHDSGNTSKEHTTWQIYCRSCRAQVDVPRSTPPFGTILACPECNAPLVSIYEDTPGCPMYWPPHTVQAVLGYKDCSLEHPRCPFCGKIVYAVIFPDRGYEVPWYANQEHDNPKANYAIKIRCLHCSKTFVVEWDEWPFSIASRKRCNFCGAIGLSDVQFMTIPEDRRHGFQSDLGRTPVTMPYLKDETGNTLWMACPVCLKVALSNHDRKSTLGDEK